MADKVTEVRELKLVQEFYDSDDRTMSIKNYNPDIEAADIHSLEDFMKKKNVTIGDKAGAAFVRFKKATKSNKKTTILDLS